MPAQQPTDRRNERRVVLNCPARMILISAGQRVECEAVVLDASDLGACLVVKIEARIGDEAEIIPQEGPASTVRGRIVWIAEFRARHETHLGIHFSTPHSIPSWQG